MLWFTLFIKHRFTSQYQYVRNFNSAIYDECRFAISFLYYLWPDAIETFLFTRGQFLAFRFCHRLRLCVCQCVRVSVCVYQSLACPHDNSSVVHAKITKFGWETQNTLRKMPIIFGGDRPWPSRSNLTRKSNFTSFWACPQDNFSLV